MKASRAGVKYPSYIFTFSDCKKVSEFCGEKDVHLVA